MSSFSSFYRGKKVLVTGHTGFKGGWLVSWLKLLGAQVIGLALPPDTQPNLFEAACIGRDMTSVFGDVRDQDIVSRVFHQHSPEIVLHNAAQPLVRRSYREPVATYATNVMGTVHVLDAVRQTPAVRALVVVTSDKAYENREWFWPYREEDVMGGHDPYSSSKGCAELVSAAYRNSFFSGPDTARIATARAGNVIGGGDWSEDRLVPDLVRGISSGKPVVIRRPDSIRPWQHVLEPLRGYLLLAQRLHASGSEYAEAWNFGPREADAISVGELAARFVSTWNSGELKIEPDPSAPHEAQFLRLSTAKARARLDWKPALDLDRAIAWTTKWYQAYYRDPGSAAANTQEQIQHYSQVACP
ncbi:MAG TPA: CDP-glucose 4,6-dehydratase [Terriglobales bacterium]|nr:CDP-glucose 4,6-dehydratase [Terriglobales bacterium]